MAVYWQQVVELNTCQQHRIVILVVHRLFNSAAAPCWRSLRGRCGAGAHGVGRVWLFDARGIINAAAARQAGLHVWIVGQG